jgi:hypothetical protein
MEGHSPHNRYRYGGSLLIHGTTSWLRRVGQFSPVTITVGHGWTTDTSYPTDVLHTQPLIQRMDDVPLGYLRPLSSRTVSLHGNTTENILSVSRKVTDGLTLTDTSKPSVKLLNGLSRTVILPRFHRHLLRNANGWASIREITRQPVKFFSQCGNAFITSRTPSALSVSLALAEMAYIYDVTRNFSSPVPKRIGISS